MSIKSRIEKLELTNSPDLLVVVLHKPFSDKPLPEPHISGGVLVRCEYDSDVNLA